MFIELVDALRCVRPHDPTWLVLAVDAMEDRDVTRGVLGCPACHAEYPIVDGIVRFGQVAKPRPRGSPDVPSVEEIVRLAALLDLVTPGGLVTVADGWSRLAAPLAAFADRVHVLVLDEVADVSSGNGVSLAVSPDDIPVRPAACRGIAVEAPHATPRHLAAAAEALRPGGRLVAPLDAPIPPGFRELARDGTLRVTAREKPPVTTRLQRGRREG